MCESPDFNFSTLPAFVFFLVLCLFFRKSHDSLATARCNDFPKCMKQKLFFFGPKKAQKPCRQHQLNPLQGYGAGT